MPSTIIIAYTPQFNTLAWNHRRLTDLTVAVGVIMQFQGLDYQLAPQRLVTALRLTTGAETVII